MELKDKVAIVTGAARGIGASIADILSEKGAAVVIADMNINKAQEYSDLLASKGRDAFAVKVDVGSEESIKQMVQAVMQKYGRIDILVNNAGIIDNKPIPEMLLEDWDRVIDINMRGAFLCSKEVIAIMIKAKSGKIVNIASMGGQVGGLKVSPDYAASKAGSICLAKSFARYGARYGITANAVCPGFIDTEMTKDQGYNPNDVPLGRLGTPEDIAKAVYFLASPLSDYITGATIDVNGGLLMR